MPEPRLRAPAPRRSNRRYGARSTGRYQVLRRVPPWPGARSRDAGLASRDNSLTLMGGSLSYIHAQRVWHEMRESAAQNGGAYRNGAGAAGVIGQPDAGAMAELGFLSLLAQHMLVCARCWQTGSASRDRPVDWLTWAVGQCDRSMRLAFGALWRDAGGEGLPTVAPRGVPKG